MMRLIQFVSLTSLIAIGLIFAGCGQPADIDTPVPGVTEGPAGIELTRTAEAAAMQTVEAALKEEATSPPVKETVQMPADTLTPVPQPTDTATIAATTTLQPTEIPAVPTSTPVPVSRPPGKALLLIPSVESPHPYPSNYDESWLISNPDPEAEATRLHFSRLELEKEADWLIIMDAQDVELQRLTGSHSNDVWTDPIPGNLLKIRLVSDGSVQQWGFAVDAVETGSYKSLAYSPHPYPNSAELKWSFNNLDAEAEGTRLHFSRLELEENVDWVVIMDITEEPYQWITGQHPEGLWTIGVPGTGVIIKLISDSSVNDWGFNIDALESAPPKVAQPRSGPDKTVAESTHPYERELEQVSTLVNPDPAAAFTKVHFTRLDLQDDDSLVLYDGDDNRVQVFGEGTHQQDFWSDDIPGRIVQVQLNTSYYDHDWGFRVDDIAPKAEERLMPAFVNAVYVHIGQPGDLSLNGVPLGRASAPGDYRIQLPAAGEHEITVESLFHRQIIAVNTDEQGNVEIEYRGVESK